MEPRCQWFSTDPVVVLCWFGVGLGAQEVRQLSLCREAGVLHKPTECPWRGVRFVRSSGEESTSDFPDEATWQRCEEVVNKDPDPHELNDPSRLYSIAY